MSAPDTNTRKQASRHRPALIGIAFAVLLGVLFFGLNLFNATDEDAGQPVPAETAQEEALPPAAPAGTSVEPVDQ